MDFRPDSRTLAINYMVVMGILAVLVLLGLGNTVRYYYSPEYTSHQDYAAPVSCNKCHTMAFQAFDQKTCSTGECHGFFGDRKPQNILAVNQTETGEPKPGLGAILGFHAQLKPGLMCSTCHPAHRAPQHGLFNNTTLFQQMQSLPGARIEGSALKKAQNARLFHDNAKEYVAKITSCRECHIAPADEMHGGKHLCSECHNDFGNWNKAIKSF